MSNADVYGRVDPIHLLASLSITLNSSLFTTVPPTDAQNRQVRASDLHKILIYIIIPTLFEVCFTRDVTQEI